MVPTEKMAGQYGVLGFWGCLPSLMTTDLALNCWESLTSRWWKAQVVRLGLWVVCSPMESLRGHVCSQEDFVREILDMYELHEGIAMPWYRRPWIWSRIHFLEAGPTLKGIHDINHVPSCFLVKVGKVMTVMFHFHSLYNCCNRFVSWSPLFWSIVFPQVQLHPEKQNRIIVILISWTRGENQEPVWFH